MKCNYEIYQNCSDESEELDKKAAEQMLLHKIKQSYEQPQRIIIRPKISVWKDVLFLAVTLALLVLLLIAFRNIIQLSPKLFVLLCILSGGIFFAVSAKKALITAIILYQKYAPEIVRSACLFEPSCSEYMKISVNKYGVCKGFVKGIKRIIRCRYPNGGVDEP